MRVQDCIVVDYFADGVGSFSKGCRNVDNFPPGNSFTELAEIIVHLGRELDGMVIRFHLQVIKHSSNLFHIHFLAKPHFEKQFDEIPLFLESFLGVPDQFEPGLGVRV